MKRNKNKEKKEKVVYYDDNSTISDMSNVQGAFNPILPKKNGNQGNKSQGSKPKAPSRFKDKWNTYFTTVKMMLIPMFVVLGILLILYLAMMGVSSCVG